MRRWTATKLLVWRSILMSKQSVRVARAHHRPSPCTLHRFSPACGPFGPSRSQPRSMPDACHPMAASSSCARSRHDWVWPRRSPGRYAMTAIRPARHTYAEMAAARMLMIAAGYEDCDDVDALRGDPALKIAVGRCPESGADLMSQPTLSRLENLADWRALARIGLGQIDLYCRSFTRPPARITLDIDDTDDPVHGQQELALFNAHYDCTCFQPILIFDGLSGKPVLSLL